ncbi:MAG: TetR/AcrR family transcriptional regulator [Perlucidibaca sp.]
MPRIPQQQRAVATVDAIIEAGFLSVARHGVNGTTTTHIADIAGISVGSLYEYFRNKEAIYNAMQERFMTDLLQRLQPRLAEIAGLDVIPAVRAILMEVQTLLLANNERYLRYAHSAISVDVRMDMEPLIRFFSDLIVQYLMRHPELARIGRLATMSYIFMHSGIATVIRHMSDPSPPISYEELVDGLAHMVNHYVVREQQLQQGGQEQKT